MGVVVNGDVPQVRQFRQHREHVTALAVCGQTVHGEADCNGACVADSLLCLFNQFAAQAGAVGQVAAIFIRPMIGQRRQKMRQQIAVGCININNVEPGPRVPAGPHRDATVGNRQCPACPLRVTEMAPPKQTACLRHQPRRCGRTGFRCGCRRATARRLPALRGRAPCRSSWHARVHPMRPTGWRKGRADHRKSGESSSIPC